MRTLLAALALTLLVGCGGEEMDPRVKAIHDKAPALTEVYSDAELVDLMDRVCEGATREELNMPVGFREQGYLIGLAGATCD